jgi:hypothetical protein
VRKKIKFNLNKKLPKNFIPTEANIRYCRIDRLKRLYGDMCELQDFLTEKNCVDNMNIGTTITFIVDRLRNEFNFTVDELIKLNGH